jgi:enediyne biosynthesis protein E4
MRLSKYFALVIFSFAIWGEAAVWAQDGFSCVGFAAASPGAGAAKPAALRIQPPQGHLHTLTIFAGFSDEVVSHPASPAFASGLFDLERVGSFSHFYDIMSFGQLAVEGTVVPRRYGADHTAHAYLNTDMKQQGGYGDYVAEVLARVDRDIDFGEFDNDGPDGLPNSGDDDGVVDYLFMVPLSTPAGFIIGRATGVAGLGLTRDFETQDRGPDGKPIRVSRALCHGSLVGQGNLAQTVGAMAHEFGHALGLPDLYDLRYEGPEDDSAGIGRWGLMGLGAHGWTGVDGPVGFCAWSLEQLGWIGRDNRRLVELLEPQQGVLARDLFLGGDIYKIHLPAQLSMGVSLWSGQVQQEIDSGYLLLEQRTRSGLYYHRNLPGEGMLVWHVRPEQRNNNEEKRKLVDLVCADGKDDLDFWAHDAPYVQKNLGNLGDAGDLFDGVLRAEFGAAGNPSVESMGDFSSKAISPLKLRMRRQGNAMRLDVDPPRWAGAIDGDVHWAGTVLVDGDVEVKPGGSLWLYQGTEVLFAPGDRLGGGLQAQQCELMVRGDMRVVWNGIGLSEQVFFRGMKPGSDWYGIVVDPDEAGEIDVPEGSLVLQDASRGIVLPGAPPGADGLQIQGFRLIDLNEGDGAGNGDGQLQPGESVRLVLEMANWSLTPYEDVKVTLSWDSPLLQPMWAEDGEPRQMEIQSFSVYPGKSRRLELPALALALDAEPGKQMVLRLQVRSAGVLWEERLDLPVQEVAPLPEVELEVADQGIGGQLALLSAEELEREEEVMVRALVRKGAASGVELVVYDAAQGKVVGEFEMRAGEGDASVFETLVRIEDSSGELRLAPRVHAKGGAVFFGPHRPQVKMGVDRWHPVLVFGSWNMKALVDGILRRELAARGIQANFVDIASAEACGDALFGHYRGDGKGIIALTQGRGEGLSDALARYLDRGGNLLVFSWAFYRTMGDALREKLYLEDIALTSSRLLSDASGSSGLQFSIHHEAMTIQAPAEPLLVDDQGNVSGFRLDAGGYRAVYLPFNLSAVKPAVQQWLLGESLDFLRRPRVSGEPVLREVMGVGLFGSMEPLFPRLIIENPGPGDSKAFKATYQVLRRGLPVATFEVAVEGLVEGEKRVVDLPDWAPYGEEDYTLRFALRTTSGETIGTVHERPLRIIQLVGRFEQTTLLGDGQGNGAASFDYDGDGDLDFYLVRRGEANRLFRNDQGRFTEVGVEAGLADPGQGRGLALGDYDGDGDLDLYLVNQAKLDVGENRLFRNEGNGRFTDITGEMDGLSPGSAPLADDEGAGRSAGFLDYDGDGDLDLYVINGLIRRRGVNRLFRNDLARFVEVAAEVGLDGANDGRGLAIGDYDRDGDADLYVANQYGQTGSQLYRNEVNEGRGFVAATAQVGLQPSDMEVAALFGDCDGDGDLDLFVSNEKGKNVLWRNEGRGETSGWQPLDDVRFGDATADGFYLGQRSVGAAFLDYDNDGDLDLATTALADGDGDELYHNRGAAGFVPVGELLGLRRSSDGRGIAPGDYDGDGRQDLLIADAQRMVLYHNDLELAPWLQVALQGEGLNANGLGARIEVSANGQRQVRELQSSYGYGSQVQPWIHVGLGDAEQVDSLRVFWPGGAQSLQTKIRVSQRLLLQHPQFVTAVEEESQRLPGVFSLEDNFPNPFNARTVIPFAIPTRGWVRLDIYDVAGQRVRVLVDEELAAGRYRRVWKGRNDAGQPVASGVYVYRFRVGERVESRRLLLLK